MTEDPARVEIWAVDLERAAPALAAIERNQSLLSSQDRRRALARKDPREQRQRLAAYTALRLLLERTLGPQAARAPFRMVAGKPALASGGATFSLSHVDGYALIGIAHTGTIGVDLELERPVKIPARRREEMIAAATGLAGRTPPGGSADAGFLLAWCRLEAFAKARGTGLGRTLSDLGLRSGRARTLVEVTTAARHTTAQEGLAVRDIALPALPGTPRLFAAAALCRPTRLRPAWLPTTISGLERLLARKVDAR